MVKDKPIISILCATDENYVSYCGVMLASVFENNRDVCVDAYILTDKTLSTLSCKRFDKLARQYHTTIHYLHIDSSILKAFPIKGMDYWSIATYYRLYTAEALPASVHRVLYLDCDIIVKRSLLPLWEIDMTGKAVAGVSDIFEDCGENQKRLLYPVSAGYFNAGVLLINVDYWREHTIGQQCLDFLNNHYDLIEANDQDVLNAVLWDKKLTLEITYNFQIQFLKQFFFNTYQESQQRTILSVKDNYPSIIHYATPQKPWSLLYYKMPFKQDWWRQKRNTPWWFILPQLPRRKPLNYLVKRFLLWPFSVSWTNDYIK